MKHVAIIVGLCGLAASGVSGWVAWNLGYSRGAEDASCYAVQAGAGGSSALPLDMSPCPPERRAGA